MVKNITNIEEALLQVDQWTDSDIREPVVPQQAPYRSRRDPLPPRTDPKGNINYSRKIIQRFTYQFKALANLIDEDHMDPATVDQAEAMMKALETMRASLDKFDDVEFEEIIIDRDRYHISHTLQSWMKTIFTAKDRNKRREKKEERLKTDKIKRLIKFSIEFPTKLEDDASVLAFMCHLIRMQPLLPADDDQEFLDEPALVSNIKSNIIRPEDERATAKYNTIFAINVFSKSRISTSCIQTHLFDESPLQ